MSAAAQSSPQAPTQASTSERWLSVVGTYGQIGFLLLKLGTLALFFGVWYVLQSPSRTAVPLAVAVAGTIISAWNVFVLISAGPSL